MKKLILVVVIIVMCSNVIAQEDGMGSIKSSGSVERLLGEGEFKNKKQVGIWKYYSRDLAIALADYGDGTGEPITKYFDRKNRLVFIGDHFVEDFFMIAFNVGDLDNVPYQYFIGFEDLRKDLEKRGVQLLNGLWKQYNENGVLISKTELVDGIQDGLEEKYYDSGNVRLQRFYFDGDLELEEIYYESGKLQRKCYYHKGKLDLETCRYYDENGNERSYDVELASVLYYDKDYKNAFTLFKEAAKGGDILAKQNLAIMYQGGIGVEKNLELAIKLSEELCEKNIKETCKILENIHLQEAGYFLEKEQYSKAIFHLKEATKTGNLDAQFNLAVMYHNGMGTDVDLEYATQLYTELCDKNYPDACINLGTIYLADENVIIEEMNSLGASSKDIARYDELKIQRKNIYKQALKPLEKAYKLKPNEDLLATINNIKSALE